MDQNQQDQTLEENLKEVIRNLPPILHTYVTQKEYTSVARSMVLKYSLHIDQGTILEREILLILLGIETLDDFTQALMGEAKIDQQAVSGIVQDINTQIFIPLREEMERGVSAEATPEPERLTMPEGMRPVMPAPPLPPRTSGVSAPPPPPPHPPAPPIPTFQPAPRPPQAIPPNNAPVYPRGYFAPPPQSPSYPGQQNQNRPHPVAPPPPPPPPHPAPISSLGGLINKIPPPLNNAQSVLAGAHSAKQTVPVVQPLDASHLLEDHEEPSPSLTPPPAYSSGIPQIEFTPLPRSAPRIAQPPQNLPGSLPPVSVPDVSVAHPSATPLAPRPVSRPYSVDPYREPVDELP